MILNLSIILIVTLYEEFIRYLFDSTFFTPKFPKKKKIQKYDFCIYTEKKESFHFERLIYAYLQCFFIQLFLSNKKIKI